MVGRRVIVGSIGDDVLARQVARRLRDEGREVVFVGGGQSPEQLVRTAIAEDATEIVVSADAVSRAEIVALGEVLGVDELVVTLVAVHDRGPRSPR